MAQVRRYDRAELRPPVRTDAGFLRADAYLTRTGVFEYRRADGTIRRELRLPEEVFAPRSLDSLQAAPLTLLHPTVAVTPQNVRDLAVGAVGTDVRQDGDKVRATVTVMDATAIERVDGGMRELSCGYDCRLDETPGEWHGERYDAIQRGVTYNHLALVPAGRAGPEVKLHLDAADAVMVPPTHAPDGGRKEHPTMRKIRIDGVDFEMSEQAAQAVEARIAKADAEVAAQKKRADEAETEAEKAKAEKDAAEEAKAKAEEAKADALDPSKLDARVAARVALVQQATGILGDEAKLDGKTDLEIKRLVVAKVSPATKLDDKSEVYVEARFDAAIEAHADAAKAAGNPGLGKLRTHLDAVEGEGGEKTAEARRDAMINKAREAWKAPVMGAKKGA